MEDKKLIEDFCLTRIRIREIKARPCSNLEVRRKGYLTPLVYEGRRPLPIEHALGLYAYFGKIQGVLVKALSRETIFDRDLPPNSPYYLTELFGGANKW